MLNPQVVVADEPTSALDVSTQKSVIRLLFDLMDRGIISSMLFITHELPLLRHVSSSIAVMYAGEFVEHGRTEQVIFDGRHPYTRALMGSMLSADPSQRGKKPVGIEGAPPDLKRTIVGCRFAERCPVARPDCSRKEQAERRRRPRRALRLRRGRVMTLKFEANDVSRVFGHGKNVKRAVDRVSFQIESEEIVSLVGQSGCGKTVLAKLLLRLDTPTSGTLFFNGRDIETEPDLRKHFRQVQAVFQDPFSAFNQFFTIRSQLESSFRLFERRPPRAEIAERVDAALLAVNIEPREIDGKYPFELSGGQMQRMLLARIFIIRPRGADRGRAHQHGGCLQPRQHPRLPDEAEARAAHDDRVRHPRRRPRLLRLRYALHHAPGADRRTRRSGAGDGLTREPDHSRVARRHSRHPSRLAGSASPGVIGATRMTRRGFGHASETAAHIVCEPACPVHR